MRRIYLLRHAKSSWQTDGQDDFDRPLNARGRKSVPVIGAYVQDHDLHPDLILCSTACRARETLALLLPFLQGEATILMEDALYLASSDRLLGRIRDADNAFSDIMIIAHNPGMQDLALTLAAFGTDLPKVREKYPTAALAQIDFDAGSWDSINPQDGVLARYVIPRALAADTDG